MNVVLAGPGSNKGSVSLWLKSLSEGFANNGSIVTRIVDGQMYNLIDEDANPKVLTWPSRRPTKLRDFIFLVKLFYNNKPDLVIANFGSVNITMICSFFFAVNKRIAWYRTTSLQSEFETESKWLTAIRKLRKKIVYSIATEIICNSEYIKNQFLHDYGNKFKSKITVFPNCVAFNEVDSSSKSDLCVVARLQKIKNHITLFKAISHLKKKNIEIKCKIIGDGPEKDELKKIAENYEIIDNIMFLGFQPLNVVYSEVSKSIISILPSLDEAFGLSIIESFACKTPVIASNVGGIPEIIEHGITGLLFKPTDSLELSNCIEMLLNNEELRESITNAAFDSFIAKYELKRVIRSQIDYFTN